MRNDKRAHFRVQLEQIFLPTFRISVCDDYYDTVMDYAEDVADFMMEMVKVKQKRFRIEWRRIDSDEEEFTVTVGDKVVFRGDLSNGCYGVDKTIKVLLQVFYDNALEVAAENERKVQELEKQEQYYLLALYYRGISADKRIYYLKKFCSICPSFKKDMMYVYKGKNGKLRKKLEWLYENIEERDNF